MPAKYCPDCGAQTLNLIETVGAGSEYKEVLTCDSCENIVYVMRPRDCGFEYGEDDHDDEDRRAYNEELNEQMKAFHHREGGGD
jgi:hypothetical protein